jgi:phenylpyruvate tautomerase PptA (4-oxalocrotonate tautomerase family)
MIVSASMLMATPAQENSNMNKICKAQSKTVKNNKMKMKNKMNSPFLIKHGLPHLSKMIMPYMNDPVFNLTAEQKEQLAKVRTTTMTAIMEAKPKVIALRKDIVKSSQAGVSADKLKDKVSELALLEAATTMTHLKCIESTKAILTKDQMYFLLTNKNKKMIHGKKQMMRGNGQPKMMMRMNKLQGQGMNK